MDFRGKDAEHEAGPATMRDVRCIPDGAKPLPRTGHIQTHGDMQTSGCGPDQKKPSVRARSSLYRLNAVANVNGHRLTPPLTGLRVVVGPPDVEIGSNPYQPVIAASERKRRKIEKRKMRDNSAAKSKASTRASYE